LEKIILGILMLKRLTVYEIRSILKKSFQCMCSDSLGGIQAALKKLLSAEMVTCCEYVEKSVNKKQYSITDKGRKDFLGWLHTPADISYPKNLELSKLLFMGLVPSEEQLPLIEETIALLEKELGNLLELQSSLLLLEENEKPQMVDYFKNDQEYGSGIQNAIQNLDIAENVNSIVKFQMLTLQYGIDLAKFQIDWFVKLREND